MHESLQAAVNAINPKEEKAFYAKAKFIYGLEQSTHNEFLVGVDERKESFGEKCKNPYFKKETN